MLVVIFNVGLEELKSGHGQYFVVLVMAYVISVCRSNENIIMAASEASGWSGPYGSRF